MENNIVGNLFIIIMLVFKAAELVSYVLPDADLKKANTII